MNVHAQPVAGAMHVVLLVLTLFYELGRLAPQDTQSHQPLSQDSYRPVVRFHEGRAWLYCLNCLSLGIQYYLVNLRLRICKFATGRDSSSYIACKVFIFSSSIDEDQIILPNLALVGSIVKYRCIGPRSYNRSVSRAPAPILQKHIAEHGFDFEFKHARL